MMHITVTSADKNRNLSLQMLRGVAAGSVVIYHAAHYTNSHLNAPWLEAIFNGKFGYYGVMVFFVLSGFLMEGAVRRYDARKFLLHRFLRLFPTYWILFLCLYLAQAIRLDGFDAIPWKALTLLPLGEMNRPLGVEWTLMYEVFFYGVCTLLCLRRSLYLLVMLVWLAIVADATFVHNQFGTVFQPTITQIPFSLWNVGFICGGIAGVINRTKKLPDPGLLSLTGLALVLLGLAVNLGPQMFYTGAGIACIVLALARWRPQEGAPVGLLHRTLFLLGEYSYGMYLVHALCIQIVLQYIPRDSSSLSVFAGMLGVGLAAGIVAGLIDVNLYRLLKDWVDTRTASALPAAKRNLPASG